MSHAIDQGKAGMKDLEAGRTSLQKFSLRVIRFMSYFRGLNKIAFIFVPCLFFYGTAFSSAVQCPPLQYVLNHIDSNNQVTYKGSLFVNNDVRFIDLSSMKDYYVFGDKPGSDITEDLPYTKKTIFSNSACVYDGPMRIAREYNCNCGFRVNKNEPIRAIKLKLVPSKE